MLLDSEGLGIVNFLALDGLVVYGYSLVLAEGWQRRLGFFPESVYHTLLDFGTKVRFHERKTKFLREFCAKTSSGFCGKQG